MNKFSNVPEELKSLKRWVVWGASGSPADGVRRGVIKAPRSAKNPLAPASATDPGTWSDFDTAVKAVTEGLASGIGFAFNGDGLCGIDLDKVITDGELTKEAEEIVNLLASYTEISPSGRGLHIIVKKSDFPLAWNRRGFLEIYEDKRYFTVTGDVYKGFVSIEKRDEEVKMLLAEYPRNWKKAPETRDGDPYTPQRTSFAGDPDPPRQTPSVGDPDPPRQTPSVGDPGKTFLRGLAKDATFKALYDGARPNKNESADDLALMNKLGYWLNKNPDEMLKAFKASPYFAQKDAAHKKKWDRRDYAVSTMKTAAEAIGPTAAESDARFIEERARKDFEGAPARKREADKTGPPRDPREYVRSYAGVTVKEVEWLWYPYIPLGKLTVMQGDPGQGKTMFCCYLASVISTGREFAFEERDAGTPTFHPIRTPGNVVFQSAEDSVSDTILPRMNKMGADEKRLFYIEEAPKSGKIKDFSPLTFLDERVEGALKAVRPKLFILDPLQGFLGADTDMHRANEVRPVMAHIGRLAEQYACAFVIVSHMNKDSQKSAIYRSLGSIDIPAAARSVLVVAKNPQNPEEKIFVHAKSSLAKTGPALTFEINDDFGITVTGQTDADANEVLNPSVKRESPMLDYAKALIIKMIGEGKCGVSEIMEEASKNGISDRTIRAAKAELGVAVKRIGYGKKSVTWWELKE